MDGNNLLQYINELESNLGYFLEPTYAPNIIIKSFDHCGITSQTNLHSALKAIIEENKIISNYVDEFYEADDIYGFVNEELEELNDLDADAIDMEIMENILGDIPNGQPQSISPSPNDSNSPSTIESNSPQTISNDLTSASTENNSTSAAADNNTTPVTAVTSTSSDPIQQNIDQHALMKQMSLLNKQLALLRANQVSNPQAAQTLPLDNVT